MNTYNVIPYVSVNGAFFGDQLGKVTEVFGPSLFQRKNRSSELEMHYQDMVLCFTEEQQQFRECTFHRGVRIKLNGKLVDWTLNGLMTLCRQDGYPLYYYDTVVLFSLGLTLTGLEEGAESDRSLTLFRTGDWDEFKREMTPFLPTI